MTSPTRPIRLSDIRYFECEGLVDQGAYHYYTKDIYDVPVQAWARANRLAALCYIRGVSITKRSLYLCFTPALPVSAIRPTDFRNEVWQRYVMFGLPLDFNKLSEESRIQLVWQATVECLTLIAPEHKDSIEEAARIVEYGGEGLEIPHESKKTKKYLIETSYTIPTWPFPAHLMLTLTELSSSRIGKCVLIETKVYNECTLLAGTMKLIDGNIILQPRTSGWGQCCAKQYDTSCFVVSIDALLQNTNPIVTREPYQINAA